ncbi:MAG: MFS transporter [Acidobacteriota bacterium]
MRRRLSTLPGTVLALGAVSFFTDVSSEMIYPLLPVFLTGVLGAGPAALGAIEGAAESTASVLKAVSGSWSDRVRRRKPLLVAGYGIAGVARPLIGLAGSPLTVLGLRLADRVGKGVRSSPRDALIADVTPADRRGEAFGVQRALDHAGAVVGPLLAAALIGTAGLSLPTVFLLAAVPAAIVMLVLACAVREQPRSVVVSDGAPLLTGWRELGRPYWTVLGAVTLFTLGNSTDAFLLLRLADAGVPVTGIALLWSLFHVVKSGATFAGGRLSDRLGRRPMVIAGWAVYACVYLAFSVVSTRSAAIVAFLVYGLSFGLTEPVEKAWVADLAPERLRGTAYGLYHAAVGIAALPASLLFGAIWQLRGAPAAFVTGAVLAGMAALWLLVSGRRGR